MTANEVHLIYFSPTHTSKQVGEAIVRGTGITNVINTNLTQQATQDLVIAESASCWGYGRFRPCGGKPDSCLKDAAVRRLHPKCGGADAVPMAPWWISFTYYKFS